MSSHWRRPDHVTAVLLSDWCSNDYLRSLGNSLYMAAKMAGSLVFGLAADTLGRQKMIAAAALLLGAAGAATALAPSMEVWRR